MSDDEFIELPPSPSSSIAGLREIGYTVNTAVADILDNSITANAKNIWINFEWIEDDSYISILDDGNGMDYETLKAAMRPGSKNPNETRALGDLGRFSLGLKTASWSQANKLYVWSKIQHANINSLGWDIDEVQKHDKWIVKTNLGKSNDLKSLEELESGTLIEWRILKIINAEKTNGENQVTKTEFYETISDLEKYLGMIFHRFIEGKTKNNQFKGILNIYINGNLIKPWNPFHASDKAFTSLTPEEIIPYKKSEVAVRGYVMPHKDILGESEFKDAAGREGWLKQQGYFVYRSDRIIVPGDWLGLGRAGKKWQDEEQYRLARLSIDINNTIDKDWSLDLKKEITVPPKLLREKLIRIAEEVRKAARNSFIQRGKYGPRPKREFFNNIRMWKRSETEKKVSYKLNLKHPLLEDFIKKIGPLNDELKLVIKLIEECIPIEQIWFDKNDESNVELLFDDSLEDLIPMIRNLYKILIKTKNNDEAISIIMEIEPFNRNPELVEKTINDQ